MTERLVAFTEAEFPEVRDAINQVRRGALEHPFQRRQPPVDIGMQLVLMKSTETSNIMGPRASFWGGSPPNPYTTGKACIVDRDTGSYDVTKEFDVDTKYMTSGLIMPNLDGTYPLNSQYLFEAIQTGTDSYSAICGGTTSFEGEIVTDEGSGEYTVAPKIPTGATAILCSSLYTVSHESFIVGQSCFVIMQGSTPWIIAGGCVP